MAGKKLQRASVEIVKYFGDTPAVRSFIDYTKRVALPGFDNMPIYYVADFFFTGIKKGGIVTRAQALAFSFFLAVFPATIFLFSLIPYIPIKGFQNELLNIIEGVLPSAAFASARTTITDIVKIQHSGLLSIGFLTALYFTTNGFMTMMRGFNSSYHASETRSPFRQRMVAIVLTFILSTLVIISTTLIIFSATATKYLVTQSILKSKTQVALIMLGKWAVVLALFFIAISFLYYYAPSVKKRWRFISAGSTFAALSSIVVSTGFAYFVNNFGSYNKIYGSIGTLIVMMLWMYFNSLILILGFELNASIDNAKRRVTKKPATKTERI
ncbi:MAG: YihY/virulence factor BrkB family protein [Bacteroidetes bacterium]|nr:YihY/virulence factor BrkB family protein [Bacteroidota bacterium]MBL0033803.1 YihY/virulence factor BrkB family protein [Bacteroidota bacterium]MBP6427034.1 YihY/virulence factor BrkB family protein [Bacteroidia bacterium]MBP6533284.1 YihY/virulence factor BrkB family protein [Bacteroidia bacterium]